MRRRRTAARHKSMDELFDYRTMFVDWDGKIDKQRRASILTQASMQPHMEFVRFERFDNFGPEVAIFKHRLFEEAVQRFGDEGSPAMEFVLLYGGTFTMGTMDSTPDPNPSPVNVTLKPFLIARTPVTRAVWCHVMDAPSPLPSDETLFPMTYVSWRDIQRFEEKASVRLPSESEWEYACRAGNPGTFSFSLSAGEIAYANGIQDWNPTHPAAYEVLPDYREYMWCGGVLGSRTASQDNDAYIGEVPHNTQRVARLRPNAFGLYDMHGNVYEQCEDRYYSGIDHVPRDGSPWTETPPRYAGFDEYVPTTGAGVYVGVYIVQRGGCWLSDHTPQCMSRERRPVHDESRNGTSSFRPVISINSDSPAI